jgi:hypothetical protein
MKLLAKLFPPKLPKFDPDEHTESLKYQYRISRKGVDTVHGQIVGARIVRTYEKVEGVCS